MTERKKKILVLGGGFAGVECARKLESYFGDDPDIELTLVSESNFLLFTPMLPQVASGMIETRHIVIPIRSICKKTIFYEERVKNIDPYGKIVTLWGTQSKRSISINYDFLVIALGSETNFFGLGDVERNAYTMKTLDDAVLLRNQIIDMLEHAENESDPILRRRLLTFVVVGGGFAGIETAGELLDLLVDAKKHYPHINRDDVRVVVLEAGPAILPGFSKKLAEFAHEKLKNGGIEIMLSAAVTGFDGGEVTVKNFQTNKPWNQGIISKTLIWTAGVTPPNTIKRSLFKTAGGKIIVDDFLGVPGYPGVFAVGDCSMFVEPGTGKPLAPTAQAAEAQARVAAYNLHSLIRNTAKRRFVFRGKGQMAIIGKRTGVATIFGINISGFLAWFLWRNVYLSKIPNLEKRVRVLLDWTIDLFFDRDISRLRTFKTRVEKEYQSLDAVDDVW